MRAISATVDIVATPRQVWAVLADLDAYITRRELRGHVMPFIEAADRTALFVTDWGSGPPVVFTHALT